MSTNEIITYVPFDEWIERPRTRLLRALAHFPDGVSAEDLYLAADAPDDEDARLTWIKALSRAVQAGEVTRERGSYRTAPGFRLQPPALPEVRTVARINH